jgi:thiol-disulfide isomerase/thioredoxin
MKKIIVFIALITGMLNATAQVTANQPPEVKVNNLPGAPLPNFRIQLTSDSTSFFLKDLDSNKKLVLMLYNPTCGHCIDMSKLFFENLDKFDSTQFVFVCGDMLWEYMEEYYKKTGFKKQKDVLLGMDVDFGSMQLFAYKNLPQIMVYGFDKKLIDVFYQDQPLDKIINALDRDTSRPPVKSKLTKAQSKKAKRKK